MFSGLIAFGVVVGLRWLAIAATGWSLGGLLLRIRMLGARNQTPSPLGSFLHADLILAVSITTLGLGTVALMRTAAADPEGRGWHDKLSGMALLHTRKTKRPDRPTISAAEPGAGPRASPPPGPRQGPPLRKDPSPRTPVRLGTLPSAPPSPPRAASRAPRARSPPRHHPRRPLRHRTSPLPPSALREGRAEGREEGGESRKAQFSRGLRTLTGRRSGSAGGCRDHHRGSPERHRSGNHDLPRWDGIPDDIGSGVLLHPQPPACAAGAARTPRRPRPDDWFAQQRHLPDGFSHRRRLHCCGLRQGGLR